MLHQITIADTYRQQVWPLLLQSAPPALMSDCSRRQPMREPMTMSLHPPSIRNTFHEDVTKKSVAPISTTPQIPSPPISPCSVIPIVDVDSNIKKTQSHSSDNIHHNNDDAMIMWYDVQRYHPSVSTGNPSATSLQVPQVPPQLVEDFRFLLLHVLEESLSPRRRYYQGYHIIAGLVLSTFLHTTTVPHPMDTTTNPNLNNYEEMYMISYATTDTIQLLKQLIVKIPFLYDMVAVTMPKQHSPTEDDSLLRVVQQIRQSIIPLYYYCQNHNSHHDHDYFQTTTSGKNDDTDHSDMDDMEQYIIGQCMTWILTLFGTGHQVNQHHSNDHSYGKRYMDVILASHPHYFIFYLCVSKLLYMNHNKVSPDVHYDNHTDECEIVIQQAIRIMQRIPPHILSSHVYRWYQRYGRHHRSFGTTLSEPPPRLSNHVLSLGGNDSYGESQTCIDNSDGRDVTSVMRFIQSMLLYLYRYYFYHDAMITTVFCDRNHPSIYYLVSFLSRGYFYCFNTFQQIRIHSQSTGVMMYMLVCLRRVSRRLLRSCRMTISTTIQRRYLFLPAARRLRLWIQQTAVTVVVVLIAIMTWLRWKSTTTVTAAFESTIDTSPIPTFVSNNHTNHNNRSAMTMDYDNMNHKNQRPENDDSMSIPIGRPVLVETEQCSMFLRTST